MVTGLRVGSLVLEPKDVEVLTRVSAGGRSGGVGGGELGLCCVGPACLPGLTECLPACLPAVVVAATAKSTCLWWLLLPTCLPVVAATANLPACGGCYCLPTRLPAACLFGCEGMAVSQECGP